MNRADKHTQPGSEPEAAKSLPVEPSLKELLDQLVVDCGEEYLKLHTGVQDFTLTDARMNYYEQEAMKKIASLFPATRTIRLPAVNHRNSEYDRGYNSGYVAGKRAQVIDLVSPDQEASND